MQVDPSICAATYISEKERRRGGGHQQNWSCYLAKFIGFFFKLLPKKETRNHLHYANICTWVFLSSLKEPATQESTEYLSKRPFPLFLLQVLLVISFTSILHSASDRSRATTCTKKCLEILK